VWANITYINISDGKLVQGEETINLDLIDKIPPNNFIYSYKYAPPRSGQYNITIFANASRLKSNTTTFNVSFGEGSAEFIFPNFRIMDNQTFNLTINVTSLGGDLFNANFTLNITDHSIINITSGETWSKSVLYNLTNGSTITLKWNCRSINEGLTRAIVTVVNQDGSSTQSSAPFEVLRPIVLAEPDVVNVSQSFNMTAKVVGNVTEIVYVDFYPDIPSSGCSVYSPSFVVNESECTGTGAAVGNIATTANESCNPSGDCDHVNDDNNETSWIGVGEGKNINISFGSQYLISKMEIVWKDLGSGSKVDILYINGTGNLKSVYNNIDVPDSKNTTVFIDFLPFQTDNIIINQTSSSTLVVYEVRSYTIEERVGKCYIFKCKFPGSTDTSGNYYVNTTVNTEKDKTMNNFSYLVNYGWPQINIKSLSMVNGSSDTYEATVTATNGDLYDLNISLGIENKTVLNLTEGSWNLTSPVIMNGNSQTFEWNVSSLSVGSANTSVAVNSSTGKAHYGAGFSNVNVVLSAGAPPNITYIWVDEETTQITKANLYTNAIVYTYAYDDVGLKNVILNLTYPDGITTTGSFQHVSGDLWRFIFGNNDDGIELNETGNYTIRVNAEDIGGQKKYSGEDAGCPENYTLNVTDEYTLYLMNSNIGPYMRGENLTVVAEDVNGFSVDNLDWYINLTRYGESGETFSSTGDNFTYQLTSTDPVGEYTLFARGTKNVNIGEQTWAFNVSNTLHPFFVEPPENTQYSPSSSITPIPQIQVLNARNGILSQTATVRLTCPNGQFYLDKVGDFYYNVYEDCRASSSSGTSFYIYANAADEYNNSGSSSLQLSTAEESYNPGGGGGGGGGSSAKECIPTKENCTDGIDNDCDGFTDCVDPDCGQDPACIVTVKDFDFNIDKSTLEVISGDNATVIGSLVNKGNMALTLKPSVKKECCEIYVDDEIFLPIKGEKDFVVVVHVPLFTNPGEYTFEIKTGIGSVEKSKTLNLIVKENPSIISLEELKSSLPELKSKIENYSSGGLNVESIKQKTNQIEEKIKSAEEAVKNDNPYLFEKMVSNAQKDFNEVNSELTGLSIQKIIFENRWNILGAFIVVFVATFLVTQVIIPYSKLRREIKALEEKVDIGKKTKASTEEQYFRREIDRETYMKIMTEEHDKVLEIESTIEEKKESMHNILTLSNILSNFFRFPLKISKRIKELITKNMKPRK
ncbi:MAG: hypothetical protein J7L43_02585, partial [Candidatus Aenigmarchaeota archaeon]|nr:hypothetical protein [Candidatus Aenigmarchaeota archaeon]